MWKIRVTYEDKKSSFDYTVTKALTDEMFSRLGFYGLQEVFFRLVAEVEAEAKAEQERIK